MGSFSSGIPTGWLPKARKSWKVPYLLRQRSCGYFRELRTNPQVRVHKILSTYEGWTQDTLHIVPVTQSESNHDHGVYILYLGVHLLKTIVYFPCWFSRESITVVFCSQETFLQMDVGLMCILYHLQPSYSLCFCVVIFLQGFKRKGWVSRYEKGGGRSAFHTWLGPCLGPTHRTHPTPPHPSAQQEWNIWMFRHKM